LINEVSSDGYTTLASEDFRIKIDGQMSTIILGFYMCLVPANKGHLKFGPWIR